MGGGVAMRAAAAKVAGLGLLNRGGEISAARRSVVASVVSSSSSSSSSSSDDVKLGIANKTNSPVEKQPYPYDAAGDWEFADEEPIPRLVFGGAPTIQEAKQATSDLNDILDKAYLSCNEQQQPLHLFDLETKPYLVTETSLTSKHTIQAFRLLHENAEAQNVVASIASDPNVWNAVLKNEALVDFLQTHKTSVVSPQVNEESSESKSASGGKGFMDYVEDIKQKITVTVVDMMTSLSDTFQSLFGGSAKDEYATDGISVEKTTIGATLMGLAIMVITVVVLKRA